MKSRSFHTTKRANTGMNGQPTEQEKLFAKYTSGEGFSIQETERMEKTKHIRSVNVSVNLTGSPHNKYKQLRPAF